MSNQNQNLTPFEKQQRIAERAHDEYQGRNAAIGYICVLVMGWLTLTFIYVPIASDIVRLFNDIACDLFDAATDKHAATSSGTYTKEIKDGVETLVPVATSSGTYTKEIKDGVETFVPVANDAPTGKPFSKLPFIILGLCLLFGFYQWQMANRAHSRWAFFGDHNDEHSH